MLIELYNVDGELKQSEELSYIIKFQYKVMKKRSQAYSYESIDLFYRNCSPTWTAWLPVIGQAIVVYGKRIHDSYISLH